MTRAATKSSTTPIVLGKVTTTPIVTEPEPPRIMQVCGTCKEWRPNGSNPVFGQCLLSAKSMQAPMMTTDLTSCRAWNPFGQ